MQDFLFLFYSKQGMFCIRTKKSVRKILLYSKNPCDCEIMEMNIVAMEKPGGNQGLRRKIVAY